MRENLSIILPTFNEESNIKSVISDVIPHIRKYIKNFEVIVINDGSTDMTLRILNGIKMSYPELKVISRETNKGYGSAIRTGIEFSQKEWIFIMDSDGQFRINDFRTFWGNRQKYDFILGYRKHRKDNLYRTFLGKFGNIISKLFLKERINDINCGFKLFKAEDLKRAPLSSSGGIINFEILYNLFKRKKKFAQFPVPHYKRTKGKSTGGRLGVITKIILEGVNIIFK